MKYKILLFGLVTALLTSCSSTYKASQTPDDVYYSPARDARVRETRQDKYEDYVSSADDQYLRMKIRDRQRWTALDDYTYWNDTRYIPSYSYDYYRNNWHSSYYWNSWNSPFYNPYSMYYNPGNLYFGGYYSPRYGYSPYTNVYINKYPAKTNPNVYRPNLGGYNNRSYNNTNPNRQTIGNTLRKVFAPTDNGYNNNGYNNRNAETNSSNNNNVYRSPERTYSPSYTPSSSGSSSSSGGGSSSSGGVSRPPR